jgi:hypothetical protein
MSGRHLKQAFFLIFLLSIFLLTITSAWADDRYLIDPATLKTGSVPKSLADAVNPQGWVLYTESYHIKDQICEVFLAKTVPASNAVGKLPYGALKEGAFVGVIHLLPEATEDYSADSHIQKLKPGYYTLRYAVMAAGTYENGTKPGDFLVLSPVSMDQDPSRVLQKAELEHFGEATSGSDVAASMELVEAEAGAGDSPTTKMDQMLTCILQVQLPLAGAKGATTRKLPMAIALVTPLHGPEGS